MQGRLRCFVYKDAAMKPYFVGLQLIIYIGKLISISLINGYDQAIEVKYECKTSYCVKSNTFREINMKHCMNSGYGDWLPDQINYVYVSMWHIVVKLDLK